MIPPEIEAVALLGWHVYPASSRTRAACIKNPSAHASCDLNVIARWCIEFPNSNWRVVCGPSRIWALDCDVPPLHAHDGVTAITELARVHGGLPSRPTMRSGGGGIAIFFVHHGERIIGDGGHPAPGIDPRRGSQSQTIPPSIHHVTRRRYAWATAPWDVSPPKAPAWLLEAVQPPPEPEKPRIPNVSTTDRARRRLNQAIDKILRSDNGARNVTLNGEAFAVARHVALGSISEGEATEALYAAARHAGLQHMEIKATIRSAFSAGLRTTR